MSAAIEAGMGDPGETVALTDEIWELGMDTSGAVLDMEEPAPCAIPVEHCCLA